jgi:1,4-alpha-glucan branching enzyme
MEPSALGTIAVSTQIHNAIVWGEYDRPFEILGAHPLQIKPVAGVAGSVLAVRFTVWAPRAQSVSVVGEFNQWNQHAHPMTRLNGSGLWQATVSGIGVGTAYQYAVTDQKGQTVLKADPYARASQFRPSQASVVAAMPAARSLSDQRKQANRTTAPISIYEVHAGSWRRHAAKAGSRDEFLTWQELAAQLPAYVKSLGFTHIELLPITEHPFDGSWGYQTLGMYSPSARFGDMQGLIDFIQTCHEQGIGVILDWVPAHFPTDQYGMSQFDGAPMFEYADPREGFHRDWGTLIYDFSCASVRNFLTGSALYWLERSGADGLRVDAVASMLYRDYSRDSGQWVPNMSGGRENWEAISLFKRVNTLTHSACSGSMMIAEESTAFPNVTKPVAQEGLGFNFKWNMGWMHDTLAAMQTSAPERTHHYAQLVNTINYAFSEHFVLPLSHDEVVHGKRSIFGRMPGQGAQRFDQLRAYYGFMWGYPGKKLLFMGQEFAQTTEWNHDLPLPWDQSQQPAHRQVAAWVAALNQLYCSHSALHAGDCQAELFSWLVNEDAGNSVLAWQRGDAQGNRILVVTNLSDRDLMAYRVGIAAPNNKSSKQDLTWRCLLSSADAQFGGNGLGAAAQVVQEAVPYQGKPQSLQLTLPAFSTQFFVVT